MRPLDPQEKAAGRDDRAAWSSRRSRGPAAAAEVEPGDIILGVNGKRVHTVKELQDAAKSAGKNVALLIQREDAQIFVPLRLPLERTHARELRSRGRRARRAAVLERARAPSRCARIPRAEVLLPVDAAVPVRAAAHGARAQLHHRRRAGALSCACTATTCCSRWAGTRSGCRPRTPRSATACRRRSGRATTSRT